MQRKTRRLLRSFAAHALPGLCIALMTVLGGPARAQVMNPVAVQGRENTKGVFVRDSAVAVDKVYQAKHMEDLREWDRAAEVYQDIIKNYADRMVPSDIDKDNEIYQYGSATPLVHEKLSGWSPDALAAYRARYEAEAAAMLDSAHDDPAVLHRVMTWYFVTDAGKQAAIRLMDLYFERGEFSAVAWLGEKLAQLHPFLNREKPSVLFRAALANHLAGDDEKARLQLKTLTDEHGDATAMIRGQEVKLAEALSKELAVEQSQLREFSLDSWPMAFGSRDRARVPEISTYGGAKLFSIEVEKPITTTLNSGVRNVLNADYLSNLSQGMMTGIIPVVDRGEMFFQDNANVYAVNVESGYPLPGWAETYPGELRGRYRLNVWATPRSHQSTVTLTEDSVLAVMAQPDLVAMQHAPHAGAKVTRLVNLDRKTGKERWVAMPQRFAEPYASLRQLDLMGSPLVVGNLVYVQARGGKGLQFEDSYVMAFDLGTGQLRWNCYVASANSGQQFWRPQLGAIMGGITSHLAYYNGRVYALTNIGAVAAVDAYDGTIVWLNIYPRDNTGSNQFGWGVRGRQINQRLEQSVTANMFNPWKHNPVIVSQGNVFVLPSDGMNVHAYDAGTGAEVKRIALSPFGGAEVLLGVVGDRLLIHNSRDVFCVKLEGYDPNKPASENIHWRAPMPAANAYDPAIMGRGFITGDSVLIPTTKRLVRLSLKSGKIEQTYPGADVDTWPEDEGAGNVIVTQDRLIIAGPASSTMRVNVYTDLALAIKKLEAEIAAAPTDPNQRLRYADIMFAAGRVDVAIQKLDEAISLLTGSPARSGDARDRIFNSAMSFAQKLGRDPNARNDEQVTALFERAGAAAASPAQKVEVRLASARYGMQRMQFDVAVRYFQQILLDETMRGVPVSEADGSTIAAGDLARREIDVAIARAGVAVYAPHEKAAGDALLAASRAGQPQQLQGIVRSYPNSVAASKALLLAAEIYEAQGNPKLATQVLRQAYFERPGTAAERTRILEAMARNYLRLPNGMDIAIARLDQAANAGGIALPRLTRPLVLPDGRTIEGVTLTEAGNSLRQLRKQDTSRLLPDVKLSSTIGAPVNQPTPPFQAEDPATTITRIDRLVVPDAAVSRPDRVITFTRQLGVRVFAVGSTTPLLTSDAIKQVPVGAAWFAGNLVVWSDSEIALLSPDTGQTLWSTTLDQITPIEVVSPQGQPQPDAEALRPLRPNVIVGGAGQQIFIEGGRQVIIRGGNIQIIAGVNEPVGPTRPANEQIAHVRPLSDRVIVGTTDGRLMALSTDGGQILWQHRPGDNMFSHVVASEEFAAVRMPHDSSAVSQLIVYDSSTGHVLDRRTFGSATGDMNPLVNIALAPDGTLLYMTARALYGKNLFEREGLEVPSFQFGNKPGEAVNFMVATSSEHLQIFGDKIVAVSSDNAGSGVHILSLRDGSRIRFAQSDAFVHLDQSSNLSPFYIRSGGSSLYLATAKEIRKIDMETGSIWPVFPHSPRSATTVRDLVVARGHVVLLTDLAGQGFAPNQTRSSALRLQAFSRAADSKGEESGLCEHAVDISSTNAVLSGWQIVDGGIYYLSGDARLHFLKGAAQ